MSYNTHWVHCSNISFNITQYFDSTIHYSHKQCTRYTIISLYFHILFQHRKIYRFGAQNCKLYYARKLITCMPYNYICVCRMREHKTIIYSVTEHYAYTMFCVRFVKTQHHNIISFYILLNNVSQRDDSSTLIPTVPRRNFFHNIINYNKIICLFIEKKIFLNIVHCELLGFWKYNRYALYLKISILLNYFLL